jgi:hypothetical protein
VAIAIIIVIVLVVIAAGGVLIARQTSQRRQFGPEYDQLVQEVGPRQARAEFAKRQKRVAGLDIKRLSPEQRAAYGARWEAAQELFIDNPRQATQTAAGLVTAVVAEAGYPVDDQDQLMADLSVNHGRYLLGYRAAVRATGRGGNVSTEDYRRALLDYRALFNDVIGGPADGGGQARLPRREQTALNQPS